MKKVACIILVCILLSSISMNVFATEDIYSKDAHMALACDVFPEFADKITGSYTRHARSLTSTPEIVYSESRQVSDIHTMAYLEYSDGSAAVASILTDPDADIYITNSSTGAGATALTATIICTHSDSDDELYVSNVKFTTVSSSYDHINSIGSTANSTAEVIIANISRQYETSSKPAEAVYSADFSRPGELPLAITVKLKVQHNSYWLDA